MLGNQITISDLQSFGVVVFGREHPLCSYLLEGVLNRAREKFSYIPEKTVIEILTILIGMGWVEMVIYDQSRDIPLTQEHLTEYEFYDKEWEEFYPNDLNVVSFRYRATDKLRAYAKSLPVDASPDSPKP